MHKGIAKMIKPIISEARQNIAIIIKIIAKNIFKNSITKDFLPS